MLLTFSVQCKFNVMKVMLTRSVDSCNLHKFEVEVPKNFVCVCVFLALTKGFFVRWRCCLYLYFLNHFLTLLFVFSPLTISIPIVRKLNFLCFSRFGCRHHLYTLGANTKQDSGFFLTRNWVILSQTSTVFSWPSVGLTDSLTDELNGGTDKPPSLRKDSPGL